MNLATLKPSILELTDQEAFDLVMLRRQNRHTSKPPVKKTVSRMEKLMKDVETMSLDELEKLTQALEKKLED